MTSAPDLIRDEGYKWGFHDEDEALFKANKGLTHELVDVMSNMKEEPDWMREFRHRALDTFREKKDPPWGTSQLQEIDFDELVRVIAWEKKWRNYSDYRPLCEFARLHRIPVVALNAPSATIRSL